MSTNQFNKRRTNQNFDFDSYLEEKSNEEIFSEDSNQNEPEEKEKSYFIRNASLIVATVLASVLWYYDWSPREAVSGIFGSTEPEVEVVNFPFDESTVTISSAEDDVTESVVIENLGTSGNDAVYYYGSGNDDVIVLGNSTDGAITITSNSNSEDLYRVKNPYNGEEVVFLNQPDLENTYIYDPESGNSTRLAELERIGFESTVSEEIAQANSESIGSSLEEAFAGLEEALAGLEEMGFVGIEDLDISTGDVDVSVSDVIIDALSGISFSDIQIESSSGDAPTLNQFSRELTAMNINQFDSDAIKSLHEAGIPADFLSKLNQVGLLERLDADEIIELFEDN